MVIAVSSSFESQRGVIQNHIRERARRNIMLQATAVVIGYKARR